MNPKIDMRSDTVTQPTAGMRAAIAHAIVGDDMVGEDPTVNHLESMMAEQLGKEAAVFACSGTQSNQMGIRVHCFPGDELLIHESGHIVQFEAGAPAALSGISCRTLQGKNGFLDRTDLEGKLRVPDQHRSPTKLVCVENTCNMGGGLVFPLEQIQRVREWCLEHGLQIHLDGARLFNACIAGHYSPKEFCQYVDTVSICFSKGLGCPMGSLLAGSHEEIQKARRFRKLFGGALRQAGMVAAAAVFAMEHHVERLEKDHQNATLFATEISRFSQISLDLETIQTNLVFFELDPGWGTAATLAAELKKQGLLMYAVGPQRLRACTHLNLDQQDILSAIAIINAVLLSQNSQTENEDHNPSSDVVTY